MLRALPPDNVAPAPPYAVLRKREWCVEFEMAMRRRLIFGAIRYGSITRKDLGDYVLLPSIRARLARYEETGNLECLVDAANLLMYEFVFSTHPGRHFSAEDDMLHVIKE